MKIFKMMFFITGILIFSGCATNKFIYDKAILEDSQCILKIPEDITVVKFDDKKVYWKVGYNIFHSIIDSFAFNKNRMATVKIPAGDHTLIVNYYSRKIMPSGYNVNTITVRKAEGIEVTRNFQSGKTYTLSSFILGDKITVFIRE